MRKSERRKYAQIAEKLSMLAEDIILTADVVKDNRSTSPCRPHLVLLSRSMQDVAALLVGEMSNSDDAMSNARSLMLVSEAIDRWSDNPTDATGSRSRAARLVGVSETIEQWAERLRA